MRAALAAHYAYYRRTARMWTSSYRDRDLVPALAERMDEVEARLDTVASSLVSPLRLRGKRRARALATVRHALRFSTWSSLAEPRRDAEAADWLRDWLASGLPRSD